MFKETLLKGLVLAVFLTTAFAVSAMVKHERVELIPAGTTWIVGRDGLSARHFEAPIPRGFIGRNSGKWVMRQGGEYAGFKRIFGSGIPVDPAVIDDSMVAETVAFSLLRDNDDLLPAGVSSYDFELRTNTSRDGIRLVGFMQTIDGVPVEGSGINLVFKSGRMVMLDVRAFANLRVDTSNRVSKQECSKFAVLYLESRGIRANVQSAKLTMLPIIGQDSLSFKVVYSVDLLCDSGRWTAFVDAMTGAIFALRDERMFMSATLNAKHHEHNTDSSVAMVQTPAVYMKLSVNGADNELDNLGLFTIAGDSADVSGAMAGKYMNVVNKGEFDYNFNFTDVTDGEAILLEWDGISEHEEEHISQIDVYFYAQGVRDFSANIQDDIPWLDKAFTVRPNQYNMDDDHNKDPEFCNAWSDGVSINFLKSGKIGSNGYYCSNMAMLGDVVHHEYGHAIHLQNSQKGSGVYDSAVTEGLADSTSSAMSREHLLGDYFYYNPDSGDHQGLRDLEPDKVWPDDQDQDEHQTGLIIGGSIWDVRKAFVEEYGEEPGHAMTDKLLYSIMRLITDIPSIFEVTLIWDDDNGNLADGTPNMCLIYDAYSPHGVASQDGFGRISIEHEQIVEVAPDEIIPVEIKAAVTFEECSEMGEVRVEYSTDMGETWLKVVATSTGEKDLFTAKLPAMEPGSEFLYRIQVVETLSGEVAMRPRNKAEPYYKVYVGPLAEIYCDDLETENDEWTHELIDGENIEGADDWQWDKPVPQGGDPAAAYSGNHVWGNDLSPQDNWNGLYQPDKTNMLTSPAYDFTDYETVRLRFRRWLTVEDGFFDKAVLSVSFGGKEKVEVWKNFASEGGDKDPHVIQHIDKEWILFDMDISKQVAGKSDVRIHWSITADGGLQFGGWNIDDICFYTSDHKYLPKLDAGTDSGTDAGDDAGETISTSKAKSGACSCKIAGFDGPINSLLKLLL